MVKSCSYSRLISSFLTFLLVGAMSGCTLKSQSQESNLSLWVVTEQSNSDGMNLQAEIIAERMEEANPGLTVILEILPTDEDERELRLTQLRTQIMSGNGPDVYLLPTGNELVSDEPLRDDNIPIEPLFPDVVQAMQKGVFLDIADFYNTDIELNTNALQPQVMSAGCIENKRFVLPLRYQIPVIYTRPDLCAQYGLAPELFESDFLTVASTVLSCDGAEQAAIGLKIPQEIETLGITLNHSEGKVLITASQIAEYMQIYQARNVIATHSTQEFYNEWDMARRPLYFHPQEGGYSDAVWFESHEAVAWPKSGEFHHECFNLLSEYCQQLYHWSVCDIPLYTGYLSDILETVGVAKLTGQEVVVYPIRALDGSVNASVAYWGAVGSSCQNPELAYSFLREFLTEEFQWDIYRPRVDKDVSIWQLQHDPQFKRQVEDSFPVRTEGCIEPLWNNLQYQVKLSRITWQRKTVLNAGGIQNIFVSDEDVPAVDWEIDNAYFPVSVGTEESLEYTAGLLNYDDGTPTDVDVEELAEDVWQALWWHLAEG